MNRYMVFRKYGKKFIYKIVSEAPDEYRAKSVGVSDFFKSKIDDTQVEFPVNKKIRSGWMDHKIHIEEYG